VWLILFCNCRSLVLRSGSPQLLTLPAIALESLSWTQHYQDSQIQVHEILKIASLSSLTKLELIKWKSWQDLSALQDMHLVELELIGCEGMERDLFLPGAFQQLQRLHIENSFWRWSYDDKGVEDTNNYVSEMQELGEVILSIPALSELSGDCGLFFLGMVEQLKTWQMQKCEVTVGHWIWTWLKT
jgi:hypothetical protein